MTDIPALVLLLTLYGGIGLLGLAILALGAYAARRKSSIILVASVSGGLMLTQTVVLYFLSDLSSGWGADSFGAIPLLCALAAFVSVAWFLVVKLREASK